ncbi:MAG: DUF4270 family protein [Bacteroidota bacterium]
MYKSIIIYLITVSLAFTMVQCNFPSSLGEDIVQSEILDVVYVDTVSLNLSTVIYDSLVTSNTARHLVGYRNDADIGSINSKAFFKIVPDSVTNFPDEDARYLYAEFEFFYDGYFYYDTAQDFKISFHIMDKELELDDDDFLYNINTFSYEQETSLGEVTFQPRPLRRRSFTMPIDDGFGQTLFEFAQDTIRNDFIEDFYDRYPGFVLEADTTITQSFLGFTTESKLIIHYRRSGEDFEMAFPSGGTRFNSISNDRSTSLLKDLATNKNDVSSNTTENKAYLNNGIGMAIKIETPTLSAIGEVVEGNFVTEASLVLKPVKDTYSNVNPLPVALAFFEVDKLNRIERQLSSINSLNIDDEFDEDTEYRLIITDFIREKLDEIDNNDEDAILIRGSDDVFGNTIDRLIIGDAFNEYEAHLELFILDYIIDNE